MKVTAILTVVSICLAVLTEAASVESPESKIIKVDEKGVDKIDFEYVLPHFEAINRKYEEGGIRLIVEEDEEFLDRLAEELQKHVMIEEILDILMSGSLLQDGDGRGISKRAVPWGKIANGIFRSALGTYMLTKIDNFWPKVLDHLKKYPMVPPGYWKPKGNY